MGEGMNKGVNTYKAQLTLEQYGFKQYVSIFVDFFQNISQYYADPQVG